MYVEITKFTTNKLEFSKMKQALITTILFLAVSCNPNNKDNSISNINKKADTLGIESATVPPESVALEFINSYVENCNKMGESQAVLIWVNENPLASQILKNELRILVEKAIQEDPEMGLGYDPLLNAQDYPEKGFEVDSKISSSNLITLKGVDQADFKITMKMGQRNGKWLVEGCGAVNVR